MAVIKLPCPPEQEKAVFAGLVGTQPQPTHSPFWIG